MVEFAMIAPVLLMVLMGMFDLGYQIYTQIQLQGRIQEAARLSTLEGADVNSTSIDERVEKAIRRLTPRADIYFSRSAYTNFRDVEMSEDWNDVNNNGICDEGEPFEDANGNDAWDEDRGTAGTGGARDAVLYTVEVQYPRLFPMAGLIGLPDHLTAEAQTILRNQPYGSQGDAPPLGKCE